MYAASMLFVATESDRMKQNNEEKEKEEVVLSLSKVSCYC